MWGVDWRLQIHFRYHQLAWFELVDKLSGLQFVVSVRGDGCHKFLVVSMYYRPICFIYVLYICYHLFFFFCILISSHLSFSYDLPLLSVFFSCLTTFSHIYFTSHLPHLISLPFFPFSGVGKGQPT